ncbi:PstS family phosphate ABC transporter substrate-binding protein [Raineya orbicola]|jgi:phosphate transport system substrate-binding protein|uniref:PBP superfamily domain n=1 Tax=Raineya orbicola TaxID=2016530 RepID=A0A2N3IJM9_9BACT|nr:substrate-binding domain-containing protein [Raineya orbicola]PKQ70443.1 PBP superfamily domain [Raineya orbicola]
MKTLLKKISLITISVMFLWACHSATQEKQNAEKKYDTPTSGSVYIAVDEAFYHIIQQQAKMFMNEYEQTQINLVIAPEDKAVALLLRDSVDAIIISRDLNSNEKKEIERQKTITRAWVSYVDAISVVVSPAIKDTSISLSQLKDIFTGKIKNWKELNPQNPDSEIIMVLDNANSSNHNFLKNKFEIADISKLKIFGTKSNLAIVEQVAKRENALGIVSFSWISEENEANQKLLSGVKILPVQDSTGKAYLASQINLAQNLYPLSREVYSIVKNNRIGLSYAFMAFLGQETGQRIFLKAGLLPKKIPTREIEIITRNLEIK